MSSIVLKISNVNVNRKMETLTEQNQLKKSTVEKLKFKQSKIS